MPRRLDRPDRDIAIQVDQLSVPHGLNALGELHHKGLSIVPREVEFVTQQGLLPSRIGIDWRVVIQRQELIQPVDMVKVSMGEQHATQASLDKWKNAVHIATVNNPRAVVVTDNVTAGIKDAIDDALHSHLIKPISLHVQIEY